MSHLKRQLLKYKDLLSNLSRRNRELYFKESTGSTINLSKLPFTANMFSKAELATAFEPVKFSNELFAKALSGREFDLSEHFIIDKIKDPEPVRKLNNKLDKIRLADDKHQREYGISGAWILGPFLCWRSSAQATKEDLLITPILKIPVDLRKNKKKNLCLVAEGDSILVNQSLKLYLKQLFGININDEIEFEDAKSAVEFLISELNKADKQVTFAAENVNAVPKVPGRFKIIKDENGEIIERRPVDLNEALTEGEMQIYNTVTASHFVIIDAIYLDQLNASRMVLINDYDTIIEEGIDHPILSELFNGTPLAEEPPLDRSKLKELDAYKERDNHFVVDIDGTQHRAIDKATKSRAIVIQGPPGTGKSQTIVNLIADYLAKGKKVLFVSDKRPALDVVFNRMKSADIESQAVLIHSSDLNKKDLYTSFLELAESAPNPTDQREWESVTASLDKVKKEINEYANVLQEEHPISHLTIADLLILASRCDSQHFNPAMAATFSNFCYNDVLKIGTDLNEIQNLISSVPNIKSSTWINKHKEVIKSTSLEHSLIEISKKLVEIVQKKSEIKLRYKALTEAEFKEDSLQNLTSLNTPTNVTIDYEPIWKSNKDGIQSSIEFLKDALKACQEKLNGNVSGFYSLRKGTTSKNALILENYYARPIGFLDVFTSEYWRMKKLRNATCTSWDGTNRQFIAFRNYVESFESFEKSIKSLNTSINVSLLEHDANKKIINDQIAFLENLLSFFKATNSSQLQKISDKARSSFADFESSVQDINELKGLSKRFKELKAASKVEFDKLSSYLQVLPSLSDVNAYLEYVNLMIHQITDLVVLDKLDISVDRFKSETNVNSIKQIILDLSSATAKWSDVLEASVLNKWNDELVSKSTVLRSYERRRVLSLISDFQRHAHQHKLSSRLAVYQSFAKRWTAEDSDRTGVPLLRKESSKERKILSPREIMEKGALKTMLQLKPCWLMSPLSISQMLPLQKGLFDVIIFDEASQVRVEDAIPSIYRASTMIVVGDNKQMPPTSFFGTAAVDDDDEDEPISPSVLDLAMQVYPSVLLEWHYRSKSEALIAFSNRAFYGGKLIAPPNPSVLNAGGALNYVEVNDAYFTSKDGNPVEAEAVLSHLIALLEKNPDRSYGIIAMGVSQANTIEDLLMLKMQNDPKVRTLIENAMAFKDGDADAGLFIKNLENVQGDERDVILMSVGYSAASEGKKMRMAFGPLSMSGGGRRLNVAITRAKSQMHVFSSFSPSEIPTDEETFTRNPELVVFGRYLKYAHAVSNGNLDTATGILNSFGMQGAITARKSSRFALDVKRRLEELGYLVSAEIGSSGFFIDLGVHHPKMQSNFLMGIECDGAIFHSTPYARDRDKIREELLVSRGWKIERVWSQDWSKNWRAEIERIDSILKKCG